MRIKLTTIILIAFLIQVSAASFGQKLTLVKNGASLDEVFRAIKLQAGFDVILISNSLKSSDKVDVDFRETPMIKVMEKLLSRKTLTYVVKENVIIIRERENPEIDKLPWSNTKLYSGTLHGTVTDSLGAVLSGASVSLKQTRFNSITNNKGSFAFPNIPNGTYHLSISYIGYKKLEKIVVVNGQDLIMSFVLQGATSELDQVQVIAYGQTTQRNNVGSISTVTAGDIAKQPVTNIFQALEGRVPGLIVTPANGAPGSRVVTQIRGQNSLSNKPDRNSVLSNYDQPLYIIDGIPVPMQNRPQFADAFGLNGLNAMSSINGINPSDIESISVLKDADATSIYGSQGSNGVILITTKRGKSGKENFEVSINSGATVASRTVPMMNTLQYLEMRNEGLFNSGTSPDIATDVDLLIFDQEKYTNWQKEFYGGVGRRTDSHISFSGGSETTNYRASGGYTHETYNFPGDFAEKRFSLHTSFYHTSRDKRFSLNFGTDYSYGTNNSTGEPSVLSAFTLAPNFPNLIDDSGNPVWDYRGFQYNNSLGNPLAYLKKSSNVQMNDLNTHLSIKYQFLSSLNVGVTAGYGKIMQDSRDTNPISSQNPANNPKGSVAFLDMNSGVINIEPQLNFTKQVSKGILTLLVGGTYRKDIVDGIQITAGNFTSDALLNFIAAGEIGSISNQAAYYKYLAGFGRVNYIWDNKYIVNLTANRNGSSNFGPEKRFGNFASAGLGWVLTEEKSIQNALPFLSFAKLSLNYGTSGSDGIQPYQYQPNWSISEIPGGYQGIPGYNPTNLLNNSYSWSKNKKFNQSLDLAFLKDRLYLNITSYQNQSVDQLVSYLQPIQTGFNGVTANAPYIVQNNGIEFSVTSKNIAKKDLQWTTNFNISHNKNQLKSFPDLASSPYAGSYVVGQPVNLRILVPYSGVDAQTGVFQFRAKDGTVSPYVNSTSAYNNVGGDATELVDVNPKFTGGLNNSFSYKGFSLSMLFQFAVQRGPNYLHSVYSNYITSLPGSPLVNMPVAMLDRWQKEGDQSNIQRFVGGLYSEADFNAYAGANYFPTSTGAYSDASYIRLKNVSFSYHLVPSALKRKFIQDCTFYINAQNLFLITKYKVGDPQTMSIFTIPPQRTMVVGLAINI